MTAVAAPASHDGGRWLLWLSLAAVLLLQFLLQAYFFPFSALFDDSRLTHIDAPFHLYQIEFARSLCEQHRLTGFDPRFAAGHIGGINMNASAKLPALLGCMAGEHASMAAVYKAVSFWSGVLGPAAIVSACLLLRTAPLTAMLAGLLAVLMWWTGPLRWYHTAGMTAFVLGAYLGIPLVVATVQVCARPRVWRLAAVSLGAGFGVWLHPLFLLAVLLAGAPWVLSELWTFRRFAHTALCLLAALFVVLALNGLWIWEVTKVAGYAYADQPYQRYFEPLLAWLELIGQAPTAAGGSRLYAGVLVAVLLGVVFTQPTTQRAMWGLIGGGLLLMAWASFGAAQPTIASLQPNRFSAMAWLCLVIPAAEGIRCALLAWPSTGHLARISTAGGLGFFALVIAFFIKETYSEVYVDGAKKYGVSRPEVKGEATFSIEMVMYLKNNTDRSSRIFFEMSLGRKHDGGHLAALYASDADREFIGGPYPFIDFANTWDATAFRKPLNEFSVADLNRLLDAYNVGWMVCHSEACKTSMKKPAGHVTASEFGPVTVFRRSSTPGFVARGEARIVNRCDNRLEVASTGTRTGMPMAASAHSTGPIVLRYHWVPGLKIYPSGVVKAIDLVPGARPFILVEDAPSQFVVGLGQLATSSCPLRREPGPHVDDLALRSNGAGPLQSPVFAGKPRLNP